MGQLDSTVLILLMLSLSALLLSRTTECVVFTSDIHVCCTTDVSVNSALLPPPPRAAQHGSRRLNHRRFEVFKHDGRGLQWSFSLLYLANE